MPTDVITSSTPVCIQITKQCGQELPGDILCDPARMLFVMSNLFIVLLTLSSYTRIVPSRNVVK